MCVCAQVHKGGSLFHIDFAYVLGDSVNFDTGDIAITPELKAVLGSHWVAFVELALQAFLALLPFHEEIITLAEALMNCMLFILFLDTFSFYF